MFLSGGDPRRLWPLKGPGGDADAGGMAQFPALLWLAMTAIGAACVVSFVYYLAVTMENERRVEVLKGECAELRKRYARQMQQVVERADIIEVSPIEESDEPLLRAAA
jgi:hypothetical protein